MGNIVIRSRFAETHKHPLADTVNAILGILLALGILIVFLSSSLIANTLNALLNQHLRYIGVIKLVGGQRRQVFFMYFTLIMAFGILALLIAVPLGGQGAYGLSLFIGEKLKFNILGYRIRAGLPGNPDHRWVVGPTDRRACPGAQWVAHYGAARAQWGCLPRIR